MSRPSFEEYASFIRDFASIPATTPILPETLFEDDLEITGDDECELLEETEKRFGVQLAFPEHGLRETFNLGRGEYLFHAEAFAFWPLPGHVRRFTVGALYTAVLTAPNLSAEHKK